jgi:hypothetical protein
MQLQPRKVLSRIEYAKEGPRDRRIIPKSTDAGKKNQDHDP